MFYGFQLTVPGFLAILIVTVPGATSLDCPSPCRCYNEFVDCSHKNLTYIQENMFNWTGAERLPELSLENNRLTSLPPNIFDPLWGLKTLNLNHNQLQILEVSLFSKLKHLKFLDMRGNMLSTIPDGLFAFQNELISLDLSNNLLSTLDVKVMTPLLNLNTLNISGNPLDCDCRLQPVVIWSSGNLENTDAKCRSPIQFKDLSWYAVTNVKCPSPMSTVIIPPSTDTTPAFEIHQSTSVTKKYTEVPSGNSKQPGNVWSNFDLYPIVIALIVILIILSLVLIGFMLFIYCYKKLKVSGLQI
jgi:Leucine-rich repeat (LRR) protein